MNPIQQMKKNFIIRILLLLINVHLIAKECNDYIYVHDQIVSKIHQYVRNKI